MADVAVGWLTLRAVPHRRAYDRTVISGGLVLTTFEVEEELPIPLIRRAYIYAHVFELLLAVLSVLAACAFFFDPDALRRTAVGEAVHPFDWAWNVTYMIGASAIIFGLLRPSPRFEALGLWFLSGAIATNAAAVVVLRGTAGLATIATYAAVVAAFHVRVRVIQRAIATQQAAQREMAERLEGGTERRRSP